jgi:hypothetical protein
VTDQDEVRNLIARYFQLLDDRDFERWAALLVEGASVTINGVERWPPDVQIMGQRGKHISVNQIIDVDTDSDSASAVFDYFYIAEIGPPRYERLVVLSFGRYTDRFVRRDGGWMLQNVAMDVLYSDRLRDG